MSCVNEKCNFGKVSVDEGAGLADCPNCHPSASPDCYKAGQEVRWLKSAKWGGKDVKPAIFVELTGGASARIITAGEVKTVRLSSIEAL